MEKSNLVGNALERAERQVESAMCLIREAREGLAGHIRSHPDSRVDTIPPRVRQALSNALVIYDEVNAFFTDVERA